MSEEERGQYPPKLRKLIRGFEVIRRGKERKGGEEGRMEEPSRADEDYSGEFRRRRLRGPKRRIF